MPFATTYNLPGPNSMSAGTSNGVGTNELASGHPHAAMVVRLAVKDVSAVAIDNAHQGIIGRILKIIAVSSCLRQPVELRPGNRIIRPARAHGLWKRLWGDWRSL